MIPQVQVGAQPPRGAWLRMSTRQQHTRAHTHVRTYTHTEETSYCSGHSWDECARGDRTRRMERWAEPHTAPQGHTGLQPLHSCLRLVTDPWGHTPSPYSREAGPGPIHSYVTALSMTPGRDSPFTTASLPESRVPYASALPTPSWASGPPARIDGQSRVGGTTLGIRSTLWPQQQVPSSRYLP